MSTPTFMMRKSDGHLVPYNEVGFDKGGYRAMDDEDVENFIKKNSNAKASIPEPVKVHEATEPIDPDMNLTSMSKEQLVSYAKEHFGKKLKRSLTQPELVDAVASLIAGIEMPANIEDQDDANV